MKKDPNYLYNLKNDPDYLKKLREEAIKNETGIQFFANKNESAYEEEEGGEFQQSQMQESIFNQ